jgi:hypothetical protein
MRLRLFPLALINSPYAIPSKYLLVAPDGSYKRAQLSFSFASNANLCSNLMRKMETPLTRKYFRSVVGTLVEEFPAVRRSRKKNCGQRLIDGVIILGRPNRIAH